MTKTHYVGVVMVFDEHAGLGTVVTPDGSMYEFHCTQISDGSRSVEPGTRVEFVLVPRHKGRLEAYEVSPTSESSRL